MGLFNRNTTSKKLNGQITLIVLSMIKVISEEEKNSINNNRSERFYNFCSFLCYILKEYKRGIYFASKGFELFPASAYLHDTLAFGYYLDKDLKKAADEIDLVLSKDEEKGVIEPSHISNALRIYKELGNDKELTKYQKILNANSKSFEEDEITSLILEIKDLKFAKKLDVIKNLGKEVIFKD